MEEDFKIGSEYTCYVIWEAYVRGIVIYNDGVTAIIRVTYRYEEGQFVVLDYKELREYFPSFIDPESNSKTEYLCMEIETAKPIFYRDPSNDIIRVSLLDDDNVIRTRIMSPMEFNLNRLRKKLAYEVAKLAKEQEEKLKKKLALSDTFIKIDIDDTAIDTMYSDLNGNSIEEETLSHSINKTTYWLSERNCAILTAWRRKYSRKENNKRNKELCNSLTSYGYGVIKMRGCYAEIGRPIEKENSFLVFDMHDTNEFQDRIYRLSEYYEQDCFLLKLVDDDLAYLIGTNDDFGKNKKEIAGILHINNTKAENYSEIGSGRISFEKVK